MAFTFSWNAIASTQFDADSPWNSVVATAIYQDITYLREWMGMSFYAGAIPDHDHDDVNSAHIGDLPAAIVDRSNFENSQAGNQVICYLPTSKTTQATSTVILREFEAGRAGVLRIKYTCTMDNSTGTTAIGKNGSTQGGTTEIATTSPTEYSNDISVNPGDLLQIEGEVGSGANTLSITEFKIQELSPLVNAFGSETYL